MIAFVCLQVIWCCRMNLCGLVTTGILAAISGICAIIAGVVVLSYGTVSICNEAAVNNPDTDFTFDQCRVGVKAYAGVAFVGGVLWIAASVLVFMFSCGDRYKNSELTHQASAKANEAVVVNTKAEECEQNPTPGKAEDAPGKEEGEA
jgi:hypothetical protein